MASDSTPLLDRIGQLLFHAQNTDNEAEAEAFYAKAQQLGSRHAIDLALALQRHEQGMRTERLTSQKVHVVPDGISDYYRKAYVDLFSAIAFANDLMIDIDRHSRYTILFGFPSDIAVTERLYQSLLITMVSSADRHLRAGANKNVLPIPSMDPDPILNAPYDVDARVWRNSYYAGFTSSIRRRLQDARKAAEADAAADLDTTDTAADGTDTVALVLAEKTEKVRKHYKATSDARGTWRGQRRTRGSRAAQQAGANDGQNAKFGSDSSVGTGIAGELG